MGFFDLFRKKEQPSPAQEYPEDWQFSPSQAAIMLAQEDGYFSPVTNCDEFSKVEKKECVRCFERKPLTSFYIQNKKTGRLQSHCKACMRETYKQWKKKSEPKLADNLPPVPLESTRKTASQELKQQVADIPKLEEFLETKEATAEQQLQDILDDLDILTSRVAQLQARLNG